MYVFVALEVLTTVTRICRIDSRGRFHESVYAVNFAQNTKIFLSEQLGFLCKIQNCTWDSLGCV
jgi:hypothetical protein